MIADPSVVPSLGALLEDRAAAWGETEFLRFEGRSMSFAEAAREVESRARKLRGAGVRPGDRVVLMMGNGLDFPLWWLAIGRAGAAMVPVNVNYERKDLAYVLQDAAPALAICQAASFDKLKDVAAALGVRVASDHPRADLSPDAMDEHRGDLPGPGRDDLANIQYTSGTTGFPKGCMLPHDYWLRLGERAAALFGLGRGDVNFTAQAFHYLDPQWNLVACLIAGAPLVIAPRFSASAFWATVKAEGVTVFYCVGAMPAMLFNQPENPEAERGHAVRLVYCSGLAPALHARVEARWGAPWREVFGMTETGVDIAVDADDGGSVGTGTIGRPVAGKAAGVFGPDGRAMAPGDTGELWVSGRPMMQGYWNKPEATAAVMTDGWFRTGDLARQDAEGRFYIVGRQKDMIRRGGENISAAEVEQALAVHPSIDAVAVAARPDPVRGEEVEAFVLVKPGFTFDPRGLLASLDGQIAAFKRPRYVTWVSVMPLTPSMRPQKHLLTALDAPFAVETFDRQDDNEA